MCFIDLLTVRVQGEEERLELLNEYINDFMDKIQDGIQNTGVLLT